jgi:hypothetical protein
MSEMNVDVLVPSEKSVPMAMVLKTLQGWEEHQLLPFQPTNPRECQRHPRHWAAISGGFPDYEILFFDGTTRIVRLGISVGSPEGNRNRQSALTTTISAYPRRKSETLPQD